MRLSDYVIQFLRDSYKVDTFFTLSGGGSIFLMDSLGTVENIKYIANHHEQASTIAAEGYARMHDKIGCCIVLNLVFIITSYPAIIANTPKMGDTVNK